MSISNLYPGGDNPVTVNLGLALYDMSYEMAENFIILDAAIGSGSSVLINSAVIPNVNFVNSATVTFSVAGSNVSATAASGGTPGGSPGDIQFNNGGVFGGSAAQTDAAGDLWVPGVFSSGNASTFPVNPPPVNTGAWFSINNTETRITGAYSGHISLYTAAPASSGVTSAYYAGQYTAQINNTSTHSAGLLCGLNLLANNYGSGNLQQITGAFITSFHQGSGTLDLLVGLGVESVCVSAGACTTNDGLTINTGNSASSTITYDTGISLRSPVATGLMSNHYGIYIKDQSIGGANNPNSYALWSDGGRVYSGGNVLTSGLFGFGGPGGGQGSNYTPDTGFSRLSAGSLALGNGSSSSFSGSLKLTGINNAGAYTDSTGAVGTSGQVLESTVTGTAWATSAGTAPGGASGDIQYNNGSGGFGGDAGFVWNHSGQTLLIGPTTNQSYFDFEATPIIYSENTNTDTVGGTRGPFTFPYCFATFLNPAANSAVEVFTVNAHTVIQPACTYNFTSELCGAHFEGDHNGTGTVAVLIGSAAEAYNLGNGTVAILTGLNSDCGTLVTAATGGITQLNGLDINLFNEGAGVVANAYSIHIGSPIGSVGTFSNYTAIQIDTLAQNGTHNPNVLAIHVTDGNSNLGSGTVTIANINVTGTTSFANGAIATAAIASGFLPLSGGTLTGPLTISDTTATLFTISGTSSGANPKIEITATDVSQSAGVYITGSNPYVQFGTVNNSALGLFTNNGSFGLVINSPTNQVSLGNNASPQAGSTLLVKDGTASTGATQLLVQGGAVAADATTNILLRVNAGGGTTEVFGVQGNGSVTANRISTGGADFTGQATVTAGNTTKAVAFANNYTGTGQPVIVLTPTSDPLALGVPVGYWVTYSGSAGAWTGFSVNVQTALAGNVTFNYIVIGQA